MASHGFAWLRMASLFPNRRRSADAGLSRGLFEVNAEGPKLGGAKQAVLHHILAFAVRWELCAVHKWERALGRAVWLVGSGWWVVVRKTPHPGGEKVASKGLGQSKGIRFDVFGGTSPVH